MLAPLALLDGVPEVVGGFRSDAWSAGATAGDAVAVGLAAFDLVRVWMVMDVA